MGVIQVQLPDQLRATILRATILRATILRATIDRLVAEGRVASEAEYLLEAAKRYAEDLEAEDKLGEIAREGNAALERPDYVTIASAEDAEALHRRTMDRLRANLAAEPGSC